MKAWRWASTDDPFATTANPGAYVPRTATEAVLVRLERALAAGAPLALLVGPTGAGKTLLLHVLAERLDGEFQPLYVPYPRLEAAELCQWVLAALSEGPASDPVAALRARLARDAAAGFPPLLLMLDDADCMPLDTRRALLELRAASTLRMLWVGASRLALEAAPGGAPVEVAEIEGRMGPPETARYVRTRLDRVRADADRRARLEGALADLHARSGGNPGRLHALVAELEARPPAPTPTGPPLGGTGAAARVTH